MTLSTSLDSLPAGLLGRIVERTLGLELDPLAVLVSGSYAADRAELGSDLDLMLLVDREPIGSHRTWFEDRPGRPLHVSCGCKVLDQWIENGREPAGHRSTALDLQVSGRWRPGAASERHRATALIWGVGTESACWLRAT